jgi:hypothetical protein
VGAVSATRPPSAPPRPPAPPSALPLAAGVGAAGPITTSLAFASLRHHPCPPCGRGWCSSAGKICCMWGGYPITTHSPSLAGVGQCPLANGHGPSDGQPLVCQLSCPRRHWRPQGHSVGAGRACAAVGRSPSAPCTLRGRAAVHPARLCAVSWAGTVCRTASGARL